jgi:hypothetical protein
MEYCCNILFFIATVVDCSNMLYIFLHTQLVAVNSSYYNTVKLRRNICPITTNMWFVAIGGQFFATIFLPIATWHSCCNICLNITTNVYCVARPSLYRNKMTNSRNKNWLSQYHGHIATFMHIVAIYGIYCNKTCTYHDKTKPWQYVWPITTNVEMVAILRFIATKCGCSNKNCCNRPDFL